MMQNCSGMECSTGDTCFVKREVVSVTGAVQLDSRDIPTAQNNAFRLPPSSCKKCLKERTGKNNKWKQRQLRKQTKAHSPIVIQLKDTLKAALKQKQRTLADTLLKSKQREESEDCKLSNSDVSVVSDEEIASSKEIKTKKDVKNLSALISVIEKTHRKDKKFHVGSNNLARNTRTKSSKFVADYVLNNATYSLENTDQVSSKPRSIAECENVEVICNDLNESDKGSYMEDTESDTVSTISSSESQCESDASNSQPETMETEMTPEELERLAQFTTGCPLIRYDCPPSECPQCLSEFYYNYQYYYDQGLAQPFQAPPETKEPQEESLESEAEEGVEVIEESQSQVEDEATEAEIIDTNSPSEKSDSPTKPSKKASTKQLLDIGIKSPQEPFPDDVYVDLTDTDVTFTVYYHHDLTEDMESNYASTPTFLPPMVPYHMMTPFTTNPYFTVPYCYWPYMYPPSYSLRNSMYLPEDTESIPKTHMIPPKELEKFNSTAPTVRPWIPVKAADKSRPSAIFTVMCYNVLCDKYCTRQMYGYCPTWALNWEYRKKGIIEEIRHGAADIISLQEVETDQFHNFFLPELQRDGYDGIFSAKSRARTMTEADRKHVDGCAIFFKTSKFNLVKEDCVEFNQLAMANAEGSDDMLNRVMTKDNIGLAAMLETKEGAYDSASSLSEAQVKQPLVVATAHIHWDPEFSDVKLIQTMMLMWRLKQVMEENFTSTASGAVDVNSIPLILCGDLNSLPESGVVEYLLSGKVARTHTDFKDIGYEDALQKIHASNDKDSFCHDFRLNTAYEKDIMPFTNYTYDFKGIIDYIFYSKDHMNLIGMLGPLEEEWFRQNKVLGCPHPHVPSDHFPLLVEFEMPARSLPGSQGTPPLVQYR
ncbi:uncharacterized protein LOC128165125 isoform X1 [Crassostrea angulata]|uniref:uncharacterized protein LOC128165125 isoform X1 n=1 Tax=Magallana angulata TaxID=2784310 RepID=UPI0022B0D984|nr:uncharacterized protein LOC128165125 isoform X1 [Crassostrea angulata]